MKLLVCTNCQDIFRLFREKRFCKCKQTVGWYTDPTNAEYFGPFALPIGFANGSFMKAMRERPESGKGKRFVAFIISHKCETFKLMKKAENETVPN